jgi:transcriptional antiterminator NusG
VPADDIRSRNRVIDDSPNSTQPNQAPAQQPASTLPEAPVVGTTDVPPPNATEREQSLHAPPDDTAPEAVRSKGVSEQGTERPADADEHVGGDEGRAASDAHEPLGEAEPGAAEPEEERGPIEEIVASDEPPKMDWYILKVQSNREDSIRDSLQRRVKVAGLDRFFGEIIVPIEMVSEFKGGKKRVVKRKLYPGYLVAHMEINEDTWFLVRETPGIGDFTGSAGKPTPMLPHEVAKIVAKQEEKADEAPKLKINFNVGDRVKINEGTFENFEGEVDSIEEASGRVTVMINIFGRSTPVELEYWQIESI